MSESALVTGGAGFIGSHVVEHLLANGWKVRVLDNLSSGHQANLASVEGRIEFIDGSITDDATVAQAVDGTDAIFHLAAKVFVPESFENPAEYERVNVHGTARLLAAARQAGVKRVVFSSTCAVYGDTTDLPITERAPTRPLSPYAANKLAAEELGRKLSTEGGPAFTALRYFNVYGPRQDPRSTYSGVISRFADMLARRQQTMIYGSGEQTRDFIHVRDVARANLLAAMGTSRNATYNVGTGRETSVARLHSLMAAALGSAIVPQHLAPRAGDIARSVANAGLIAERLNFTSRILVEKGIAELLAKDQPGGPPAQ